MTTPVDEAKFTLRILDKIVASLDSIKRHVTKESEELVLRLPESVGEYSVAIRLKSGMYGGKTRFSLPGLSRLETRALPALSPINETFARDEDGFFFDPSRVPAGVEMAILQFEFSIPESQSLNEIVQRNVQLDSTAPDLSDSESYWMTSQLKHPSFLRKTYSRLELYGVDFRVDVGVHQEIKNSIPHGIMKAIQRSVEFIGTTDREKLLRLMLQQRKTTQAADIPEAVRQLIDLFVPTKFKKFVSVNAPFRFQECQRGTEFFERLFLALPKFMTIVSRTDLTLEQPARQGTLTYKKRDVREEIAKLFPTQTQ